MARLPGNLCHAGHRRSRLRGIQAAQPRAFQSSPRHTSASYDKQSASQRRFHLLGRRWPSTTRGIQCPHQAKRTGTPMQLPSRCCASICRVVRRPISSWTPRDTIRWLVKSPHLASPSFRQVVSSFRQVVSVEAKPIPRWDVHFGSLEDCRKDSTVTSYHLWAPTGWAPALRSGDMYIPPWLWFSGFQSRCIWEQCPSR